MDSLKKHIKHTIDKNKVAMTLCDFVYTTNEILEIRENFSVAKNKLEKERWFYNDMIDEITSPLQILYGYICENIKLSYDFPSALYCDKCKHIHNYSMHVRNPEEVSRFVRENIHMGKRNTKLLIKNQVIHSKKVGTNKDTFNFKIILSNCCFCESENESGKQKISTINKI